MNPQEPQGKPMPSSGQTTSRKNIQGWLIVFGLGCFLGSCNPLATVAGGITSDHNATTSSFHSFYYFYALIAVIGLWSIVALIVIPRRSTSALWMVVILFVLLVLTLINWLWQEFLLSDGATAASEISSWRIDSLRGVLWLLVWLVYFFRSKHVKENYGDINLTRILALLHLRSNH